MSDATNIGEKVTIADVAKTAGVATSTVSRALSKPGRVSEAMRQKIVSVANEMGYYPNPQARSLKSGRTQNVALLIPDITNPFFFGLFRATQAQARARGYLQFVVNTEESAGVETAYLAELGKSVDGVVLAASRLSDEELTVVAQNMPIVTINRDIPNVPSVIIDTPGAMAQAVDHLVSLGHSSIAYLSGPESSWSSRKRWKALQQAARSRNVKLHDLGPFAPTVPAGAAAADSAITTGVTACIFFNDLLAIGALRRFAERGLRVPQDISVIGCDDIFGADFCSPPLTTFAAPIEQAGRLATDMLMSVIQDRWGGRLAGGVEGRRHERLATYLTIRESTGPAPTTARLGGGAS
jgi:LacI family repressor for deo operon, udp, cdd, tsx, nupC, and nupG